MVKKPYVGLLQKKKLLIKLYWCSYTLKLFLLIRYLCKWWFNYKKCHLIVFCNNLMMFIHLLFTVNLAWYFQVYLFMSPKIHKPIPFSCPLWYSKRHLRALKFFLGWLAREGWKNTRYETLDRSWWGTIEEIRRVLAPALVIGLGQRQPLGLNSLILDWANGNQRLSSPYRSTVPSIVLRLFQPGASIAPGLGLRAVSQNILAREIRNTFLIPLSFYRYSEWRELSLN